MRNTHRLCGNKQSKQPSAAEAAGLSHTSAEEVDIAMNARPHTVDGRVVEPKRLSQEKILKELVST